MIRYYEKRCENIFCVFLLFCFGCENERAIQYVDQSCNYEISFNNEVRPLIISRCANNSCHAFEMNSANLMFSNYSNIYQASLNDNFLGTIKHQPGYPMMPQDTSSLLPEEIQTIECWIEQGRKNN